MYQDGSVIPARLIKRSSPMGSESIGMTTEIYSLVNTRMDRIVKGKFMSCKEMGRIHYSKSNMQKMAMLVRRRKSAKIIECCENAFC